MSRVNFKGRAVALATSGLAATSIVALAGCPTWDDFTTLGEQASVTRVRVEGEGGPRFGSVLVGYEVPVQRDFFVRGTRLYVGGESVRSEIPATYGVFRIWDEIRPDTTANVRTCLEVDRARCEERADGFHYTTTIETVPPAFRGCHQDDRDPGSTIINCGSGRRAGAGFPYMHNASSPDWQGCVAVTVGEVGMNQRMQIRCESIGGQTSLLVPLENDLEWGASAAGVPIDHPFGVGVFGAPNTDGTGALFRLKHLRDQQTGLGMGQPEGGTRRAIIPITGLALEDGARLGRSVALTLEGNTVRIAAAFGATERRVVVADVTSADGTSVTAEVVGCLAGGRDDVGFGDALAFGDFDGDGTEDLAIGGQSTDSGALPVDRPVQIFDGSRFGGVSTCSESSSSSSMPAVTFGCLNSARGTPVGCMSSRFGHTLAAGDFDGDGQDDLAVGAPGASTGGPEGTGIVQTIAGTATLSAMGSDPMTRGTLWLPSSVASSGFGSALAAIPAPMGRADIAVSQNAPASTHVFYCSDLPGDTPETVSQEMTLIRMRGCGLIPARIAPTMIDPRLVPSSP